MIGCLDCGRKVHQTFEKAVASGEVATVWADDSGGWTCERTGDEHRTRSGLLPYEVEFTVIAHVLAEDADRAYEVAEPTARQAGTDGAWSNYDNAARRIAESEF